MSLYKTFATDKSTEQDGILVTYGNVRFLIARAGGANKAYSRVFKEIAKPFRFAIEHNKLSPEQSNELLARVYAKTVVRGWETLELDEDGNPLMEDGEFVITKTIEDKNGDQLEFNEKNCIQVLCDLPDLFADIQSMAGRPENFSPEDEEADAGN